MCKYSCQDDVYDSLVSYFRCQPLLSTVKVSGHFRVTDKLQKSTVQAQVKFNKGKMNLASGLSLKCYGPPTPLHHVQLEHLNESEW